VRRGAAFALGKLGGGAALATSVLVGRLQKDNDASVREAAAFALGEIGPTALTYEPKLPQILIAAVQDDKDALVRRSAVLALGSLAGKEAEVFDAVRKAASDSSPSVRQNAAFVLGRFGAKALEPLRATLTDDDALVIRDSANALRGLGKDGRPAVPQLVDCLNKPGLDGETKRAVLGALVKLVDSKDKAAVAALARVLGDTDAEVRINAALVLGNIGGDEAAVAVPVLREALRSGDPAIRSQAAAALNNIGPRAAPALPDLIAALSDKQARVRMLATVGLGGLGKEAQQAIPALVHVVKKSDEQVGVRYFAASALANIGYCEAAVQAVPDIIQILTDPKAPYSVRWKLISALRVHNFRLKSMKEVLDGLEKVLTEPPHAEGNLLRYDAAYILGMIQGPSASEKTLDTLQDFLSDSTILLYKGSETDVSGGAKEGMAAQAASVREKGSDDGRVMAVQALDEMGRRRVVARPEVVKQLRAIAADAKANTTLREEAKKLLSKFQL
jgi:HEAT repeat protein